jgi:hypothetical protein
VILDIKKYNIPQLPISDNLHLNKMIDKAIYLIHLNKMIDKAIYLIH